MENFYIYLVYYLFKNISEALLFPKADNYINLICRDDTLFYLNRKEQTLETRKLYSHNQISISMQASNNNIISRFLVFVLFILDYVKTFRIFIDFSLYTWREDFRLNQSRLKEVGSRFELRGLNFKSDKVRSFPIDILALLAIGL